LLIKVLIDADACPRKVMEIVGEARDEFGYELVLVSSFNHRHTPGPGVRQIYVGDEDQATDLAVINETAARDIVITQDWGLAALVLGRGARAIDPNGRVFSEEKMEFLLEERHLKAKYRRSGGRTRGPSARKDEHDRRFRESFWTLLRNTANKQGESGACGAENSN